MKMTHQTDLLRAPTRKRKPDNMVIRQPRVVKMTWDINPKTTRDLFDDMGVAKLEDDGEEVNQRPTPPVYNVQLLPCEAPQMTVLPSNNLGPFTAYINDLSPPFTYSEPPCITDTLGLIRRQFTAPKRVNDGIDHWKHLSEEMILQVFRWLPKSVLARCLRVCKRWHNIGQDETLWRRLDLASKTLKPGVLGRVLDRGVTVLRLTRTDIKTPLYTNDHNSSTESLSFTNTISQNLNLNNIINNQQQQQYYSKVLYLDISMATVSTQGLEQLLGTCHMLRKLSLENCQLSDEVCRAIGQNRYLEVLNLSMCQGITENGLVHICNNLKRLEALNIGWTNMSREAVIYAVTCLPSSLTKLNFSGCRETLPDEDVQQLCSSCPSLKELDLSDATQLTCLSVQHIASSLGGLEYIALSRCYHIVPSSLPLLLNIPTLLALDVFGMLKESALYQLREAMPSIEINKFPFSSIARPTTGIRRTSIWGLRVRDSMV